VIIFELLFAINQDDIKFHKQLALSTQYIRNTKSLAFFILHSLWIHISHFTFIFALTFYICKYLMLMQI